MDIASKSDVREIVRDELEQALGQSRSEPWMSTATCAEYLDTSAQVVRDLVSRQGLPAHKASGTARLLFSRAEVDAWVVGKST